MHRTLLTVSVVSLALLLACQEATAQVDWLGPGSRRAEVETAATATSGSTVPFWLHANTRGLVDPASSAGWTRVGIWRDVEGENAWALGYGIETVARMSANEAVYLSEMYVEARYRFLRLHAGRKAEVVGSADGPLTSGSMGTSRNATPIPQVVLATDGYTDVPFTNRWVEFKGRYAHGWMPDNRVVEDAYLHQKTLYLRAGAPSPVSVHAGLIHNAMWGGTSPRYGQLPQSIDDYRRTVFALNGDEDAPPGEEVYILGNHLGAIDVGLSAQVGPIEATAYRQFVYEDRDNLKLKSPQDGLFGIVLADRRSDRLVDRVVYEHLYTKWQNGPVGAGTTERGGAGGQDNYYNHGIYESGWTFYGRTAGTPLLTPFDGGDRAGIANNRVVGHHAGVAGHVGPARYRVMATYTRNYGTYKNEDRAQERGEDYPFNPPQEQTSFLVEARMPWPTDARFEVTAAVGVDVGEMYDDAVGGRIGLVYHPLRSSSGDP